MQKDYKRLLVGLLAFYAENTTTILRGCVTAPGDNIEVREHTTLPSVIAVISMKRSYGRTYDTVRQHEIKKWLVWALTPDIAQPWTALEFGSIEVKTTIDVVLVKSR
jgi:hypothetical protein